MRKVLLAVVAVSVFALQACGTILKPNQVGKAHSNKLDTKIVVLDAIGLFFFLIPGVVAFGVDWYNGTLFLPRGYAINLDEVNAEEIQKALADNGYNVSVEEVEQQLAANKAL